MTPMTPNQPNTLHPDPADETRLNAGLQDSLRLDNLERFASERPLESVLIASALGYLMARSGLGSPVKATGQVLGGAGDLAGGALRGTAGLAGEALKGTGSLASGVVGAAVPLVGGVLGAGAHLAGGALGAGAHLAGGALEAGKDVAVGTGRAGFKLGGALLTLLPVLGAVYLLNAVAGQQLENARGGR